MPMRRFILRCNVERFERALEYERDPEVVLRLTEMLAVERRELALLVAREDGAPSLAAKAWRRRDGPYDETGFREAFRQSAKCLLLIDPGPGLPIVDVNEAYAQVTGVTFEGVVGRRLFEVFPENPDHILADGVSNLAASLRRAAETELPDQMPIQRYDVGGPDGGFVVRYWRPRNTPIFGEGGDLLYLLHEVEEVAGPA